MYPRPPHCALLLAAAMAAMAAGCKSDRPVADAAPAADAPAGTPAAAAAPAVITVTATDFKLELPARIPGGLVTLKLVNHGKELHQAQLVRLEDGKTAADFEAAIKRPGPPPAWAKFVGGPNAVAPRQETASTSMLAPGQYVALCLIPGPDEIPHLMKGMIQPFEVTPGGSAAADALPAAADTIRLVDYTFELSRPLTPGHHTIVVENAGPQPHELVLLRLAPGKTLQDFGTWATTGRMKGPPPAMPLGGIGVMDQGGGGEFSVELTPGEYGLICFVPDAKDGKLHLMHGMMEQFKVG
jgi:hypothetical protein